MPYSYAQFQGLGSAGPFSVPFPFLLRGHVKLYLGLDLLAGSYFALLADGTDYTWSSATQVQLTAPLAQGTTLTIRRETPTTSRLVDWNDGSNLNAADMDAADLQNFYVVQELQDRADLAAAVAAATAAAVAAALPYAVVANVASIPVATEGARIEVANSAGIESFSPLTGMPLGFVGSAQARVRLRASGLTWIWVDYAIADPDGRYVRLTSVSSSTASASTTTVASSAAVKAAKDAADAAGAAAGAAAATASAAQTAADAAAAIVTTARLADGSVTTPKLANGAVTPAKLAQPMTLVPAKAATNLTELIFDDIPAWATRITCAIDGLSLIGNGHLLLQVGTANGFYTSDYKSTTQWISGTGYAVTSDIGIISWLAAPLRALTGHLVLTPCCPYTNGFTRWVISGSFREDYIGTVQVFSVGSVVIPQPLTRLRLLSSDMLESDLNRTFDAGFASIIYDG